MPAHPRLSPITLYPSRFARIVTALIAGLSPGTSPPPVRIAIIPFVDFEVAMIFCFLFDSIIDKFKTSKVKHFNFIPKTVIMSESQTSKVFQKNLTVLITGGSGLIGKYLTSYLLDSGYKVSHLSRIPNQSGNVRTYMSVSYTHLRAHETVLDLV